MTSLQRRPLRRTALALALATVLAGVPAIGPGTADPLGGVLANAAAQQPAQPATADQPVPRRVRVGYATWRKRLKRHGLGVGPNLLVVPASAAAESASNGAAAVPAGTPELRAAIHRMQRRWQRWLRHSSRGRAVAFKLRVRRAVPAWGRQQLRSIAWCESKNDPRAVGGGGAYRGMYQFSFSTWAVVGGSGDPVAASRWEQTWRAWLLLSRHGSGHWPVCG